LAYNDRGRLASDTVGGTSSTMVYNALGQMNDLLLDDEIVTDDFILHEFIRNWHPKKTKFSRVRLVKELVWMRDHGIVPKGFGAHTSILRDEAALTVFLLPVSIPFIWPGPASKACEKKQLRSLFKQTLGRNPKLFMQTFDHSQSKGSPAAENFVYAILAANHRFEIFDRQT
jgi:hypothetical protein